MCRLLYDDLKGRPEFGAINWVVPNSLILRTIWTATCARNALGKEVLLHETSAPPKEALQIIRALGYKVYEVNELEVCNRQHAA